MAQDYTNTSTYVRKFTMRFLRSTKPVTAESSGDAKKTNVDE